MAHSARASHRLLTAAASVVVLVLAACSGGDPSPTSGLPEDPGVVLPDPCALLGAASIEAFAGVPMGEGVFNESLSTDFQSICDWGPVEGAFPLVQVLVNDNAGGVEAQRASAGGVFDDVVDAAVPGATDAYSFSGGSIIAFVDAGFFVQVAYTSSSGGAEAALALATEVAAAL